MSIENRLRNFIVDELRSGWVPVEVTDDLLLIDRGVIDSLGVFELLAFLEREFGIEVGDHELITDNFRSVNAIAEFVRCKTPVP
jgi:acyl carrier protein